MTTVLPPPAVSTPAHEWAAGTTDALGESGENAKPTANEFVATRENVATPGLNLPGGYPQTPSTTTPISAGDDAATAGITNNIPSTQGIVEAARQYIPTQDQIPGYVPAAVRGYFPASPPKKTDTNSVGSPLPEVDNESTPSTIPTGLVAPRDDPSLGNLSTQATAGTPAGDQSAVTTPTGTRTQSTTATGAFTPATDVVPEKGVDATVPPSDFREELLVSDETRTKSFNTTTSSITDGATKEESVEKKDTDLLNANQDKSLPTTPQVNVDSIHDHPLPGVVGSKETDPLANATHDGDTVTSPVSKPSLSTGATVTSGVPNSTSADAGHSVFSDNTSTNTGKKSIDASGSPNSSRFHETGSKISNDSSNTTGSGKVKLTDKLKGEIKVISGKLSKDEHKVEEGKRLMGKIH